MRVTQMPELSEMMTEIEKLSQLDKDGKFIYLVYTKLKDIDVSIKDLCDSGGIRGAAVDKLVKQVNGLDVKKIENAIMCLERKMPVVSFKQKAVIALAAAIPSFILLLIAMFKLGVSL